MADGVVGEHTEVVTGVAGQVTKQKHEHVLILLQLLKMPILELLTVPTNCENYDLGFDEGCFENVTAN